MKLLLTSLLLVVTQAFAFSSLQTQPRALQVRPTTTNAVADRSGTLHLRALNPAGIDAEQFAAAFRYNLRKDRLSTTYKATSIAYALYALQNIRVHSSLPYGSLLASGHGLAAGLAYILSKAASKDHLFLFTSKRYNLALLGYGACKLAVTAIAGRVPGGPLLLLGPLLANISSIQGYSIGVRGWEYEKPAGSIVIDVKKSASQAISSMLKVPKTQSLGYMGATLLLVALKLDKLKKICEIILSNNDVGASLLVPLARFARLAIFSAVAYTLKDGADRGLLDSPNFILLNLLSAASFGALASYVGATTAVGGLAALFSVFSGVNGLISVLKSE